MKTLRIRNPKSKIQNLHFFPLTLLSLLAVAVMLIPSGQSTQAQGKTVQPQAPVGSAFTYQGQLKDGSNPANGQYDFQFTLYDAATDGAQVDSAVNVGNQAVTQGLFTVALDFGVSAFTGQARWLEIAVRPAGGGAYTTLAPRQPLTAVPYAQSLATGSTGAVITANIGGPALIVTNTNGTAVRAAGPMSGGHGVYGSGAIGVFGESPNYVGVYGSGSYGLYGTGSQYGVYGSSTSGYGVRGQSSSGYGVAGISSSFSGVRGESTSASGVWGSSTDYFGVYGSSTDYFGVGGFASTTNYGVYGSGGGGVYGVTTVSDGVGVRGTSQNGYGVHGITTGSGYAGYFSGRVHVQGTLSKSAGSFKIDHPLDPANKYLSHSFVESPDMMNVYNGNVTTDAKGEAVVALPEYFEELNRDFRYQLTIMGEQFAQARVSSKVKGNRFTILTDKPSIEVSWQVTGIRKDPYAQSHPIVPEVEKPASEKGKYLHPEEYGQPESMGVGYEEMQRTLPDPPKP